MGNRCRPFLSTLLVFLAVTSWAAPPAAAQLAPLSAPKLPDTLALFPLPNVAVLPYLQLPLHVFEPRYREMLADALAGNRVIGIVQIQPGFEAEYEGRPPLFSIGCAAIVITADRQPSGESDIILRGFMRFRITGEVEGKPYRVAHVEPLPDINDDSILAALHDERAAVEAAFAESLGVAPELLRLPPMSDADLVNSVVMTADLDTVDRQVLIEQDSLLERARKLVEFLRRSSQPAPQR